MLFHGSDMSMTQVGIQSGFLRLVLMKHHGRFRCFHHCFRRQFAMVLSTLIEHLLQAIAFSRKHLGRTKVSETTIGIDPVSSRLSLMELSGFLDDLRSCFGFSETLDF